MLSAYCIGNAAGPFMWQAKYKPRQVDYFTHASITDAISSNHVPWITIGICYVLCMVLLFIIRVLLARENKRRDAEPRDDTFDNVYVVKIDEDGNRSEVKVSKVRVSSLWLRRDIWLIVIPRIGVLGFDRSAK
jgi:hypothetical protein